VINNPKIQTTTSISSQNHEVSISTNVNSNENNHQLSTQQNLKTSSNNGNIGGKISVNNIKGSK
jgi:hypothetical protein